jgi:hypothetical protein
VKKIAQNVAKPFVKMYNLNHGKSSPKMCAIFGNFPKKLPKENYDPIGKFAQSGHPGGD